MEKTVKCPKCGSPGFRYSDASVYDCGREDTHIEDNGIETAAECRSEDKRQE